MEAPLITPPSEPQVVTQSPVVETSPKRRSLVPIIVGVIVLFLLGGTTYAYYESIGPFAKAPYTNDNLISGVVSGIGKIDAATYNTQITLESKEKEADAKPFKLDVPENKEELAKYQRDYDRFADLRKVDSELETYYNTNKRYPTTISNNTFVYTRNPNNIDFSLTVNFETAAAKDLVLQYSYDSESVKNPSGNTIVFNRIGARDYYSFSGQPRQPALVEILSHQADYVSYIPKDFFAKLSITGNADKAADSSTDNMTKVVFDGNFGDISAAADVEFRKKNQNYFILINKMPTFFFDLSSIKKKWVKMTQDDLATSGYGDYLGYLAVNQDEAAKKKLQLTKEQIIKVIQIANDSKVLDVVGNPVTEKIEGNTAYKYNVKLNQANIVDFYKKATDALASYKDDQLLKFDQSTLDSLESPVSKQVIDYINQNSTILIWANAKGIPVRFLYSLRLVPEDAPNTVGKEIVITFDTTLSNINKPQEVEEPKDSITFEEANLMLRGITKEQYEVEKVASAVSNVRYGLESYYRTNKVYPETLDALLKKDNATGSVPILKVLPKGLAYQKVGDDYALTYSVALPTYDKTQKLSYDYYSTNYPPYDPKKPTNYSIYTYSLKVVNGVNIADKTNLSKQAFAGNFIDSDKDRLADNLETYLGTNPLKADSDGDGRTDGEEFISGSNPLGAGALKPASGSGYFY